MHPTASPLPGFTGEDKAILLLNVIADPKTHKKHLNELGEKRHEVNRTRKQFAGWARKEAEATQAECAAMLAKAEDKHTKAATMIARAKELGR